MKTTTTATFARRSSHELVCTGPLLLAALERVDVEGWDNETGRAILDYAMERVVRPAVRAVGFTGADAEFAASTGWTAAWETLTARSLRHAGSPWGVVSAAARSAVLNERMSETYGTKPSSAWRVHRFNKIRTAGAQPEPRDWNTVADTGAMARPVSLTAMIDAGFEPANRSDAEGERGWSLATIADVLVRHGWQPDLANAAVEHIAEYARPNPAGPVKARGWREMAADLGLPPWQARRVTVLVLGTASWPGLVERVATEGPSGLEALDVQAAVRATVVETMRPPARAALAINPHAARVPAMAS